MTNVRHLRALDLEQRETDYFLVHMTKPTILWLEPKLFLNFIENKKKKPDLSFILLLGHWITPAYTATVKTPLRCSHCVYITTYFKCQFSPKNNYPVHCYQKKKKCWQRNPACIHTSNDHQVSLQNHTSHLYGLELVVLIQTP